MSETSSEYNEYNSHSFTSANVKRMKYVMKFANKAFYSVKHMLHPIICLPLTL